METWRLSCWSARDRKSTRLNSSHTVISYAVFCLKKKKMRMRGTGPYADKLRSRFELAALKLGFSDASERHFLNTALFRPPFVFFNDTATTEIYTLSLHDALPI